MCMKIPMLTNIFFRGVVQPFKWKLIQKARKQHKKTHIKHVKYHALETWNHQLDTLPKANIASENRVSQKESPFPTPNFQGQTVKTATV